ncbi:hypothetical protein GCM10025783_22470 [Amnibacterium soli]|uniref:ABC transporter n=1 Tax=Amnibacterium soli TaxID=1282736 RepID=A0ABP8Z8R6_9MICO
MADPNRPEDDAADDARRPAAVAADGPAATTPYKPARADDEPRTERLPADRDDDVRTERLAADRDDARTEVVEPAAATAVHPHADAPAAPPAQRPLPTTEEGSAPPPPRKKGNRLVATAWVLLAAGLFQAVFFGANALVALVFGGTAAVLPQVQSVAGTSLAWLPVLLFFLLFELTVLLINRAGRVAYVLASLIVGAIVYVLTVVLFSVLVRHTLGDANTLAQTFLNWEFILVGLVAREVMLWTGLAIGSRGIRVRRRYREARRSYEQEVGDVRS